MIALLNHAPWIAPLVIAAVLSALSFAGRRDGFVQHERDGGGHA